MEDCKTLDELIEKYKAIKNPTHNDSAEFLSRFIDIHHPEDGMRTLVTLLVNSPFKVSFHL